MWNIKLCKLEIARRKITWTKVTDKKACLLVTTAISRNKKYRNTINLLKALIKINLLPSFMVQIQPILWGWYVCRWGNRNILRVHVCHDTTIWNWCHQIIKSGKTDPYGNYYQGCYPTFSFATLHCRINFYSTSMFSADFSGACEIFIPSWTNKNNQYKVAIEGVLQQLLISS